MKITPHPSKSFQQREFHHLYESPFHSNHCLFSRVVERAIGRYGYLAFKLWQPEVLVRDRRPVLSKTRCLMCVGVGRSDGRHKANPSFHAITKISRIREALAVLMMGNKTKASRKPHYHDSTLKAPQEHCDQVVKKMVFSVALL